VTEDPDGYLKIKKKDQEGWIRRLDPTLLTTVRGKDKEEIMKTKIGQSMKCLMVPVAVAAMVGIGLGDVPLTFAQGPHEITIVIKDKEFHVVKGGAFAGGIEMSAGMPTQITLQNEDGVAHEFVSPMFMNLPVKLEGTAVTISTPKASGFRVDPGNTVVLTFRPPVTPDFSNQYDVFWCNVHGRQHGEKMRGEVLISDTRGGEYPGIP